MGNAMCGVCVGIILIPLSFYIIGKNEMNAVCTRKSYDDAKKQMVETNCLYNSGNDGEFIHYTCDVNNTNLDLKDTLTGVSTTAFSLTSTSYQYQWSMSSQSKSVDNKVGGGTTTYTCYCFTKNFFSKHISIDTSKVGYQCSGQYGLSCAQTWPSSSIKQNTNLQGGDVLTGFATNTVYPDQINLYNKQGGTAQQKGTQFRVPQQDIHSIMTGLSHPTVTLAQAAPGSWTWNSGSQKLYLSAGGSESYPEIGDRYIGFVTAYADQVSAVGTQSGLQPAYLVSKMFGGSTIPPCSKGSVLSYEGGSVSGDQMFENLKEALKFLTWVLRAVTFFMLFLGFYLIVAPLSVMPDIIPCVGPFIGDLVGGILCVCSCCTAFVVWLIVVGICWLFARPALGGALLAGGLVIFGVAAYFKKKKMDDGGGGGDYHSMV